MLGPILSAVALAQLKNRAERAARNMALSLAAGLMAAVAVGFLVAAGFVALLPVTGPIWTSVIAAVLFAAIALVFFAMKRANRPPDRTPLAGAAMLGAVGGGTAKVAAGGDRPRYGRPSMLSRLASNKMMVILPAAAFAVAVIAGRRNRARRWDDDRWD
jgi:O-antigen/teichoic acid export membrane protein